MTKKTEIKKVVKRKASAKKIVKKAVVKSSSKKVKAGRGKNKTKKSVAKSGAVKNRKIKNNQDQDAYLAKWTAPEFIKTNEEMLFYYLGVVGSVLAVVWSLWSGSFISAVTFAMLVVIIIFQIYRQPLEVECLIDLDGIALNQKLYKYEEINSFEVIQGDENNVLKFNLKNAIMPIKEMQLADQDPYYIRAALKHFLPEKKQKEALVNFERKKKFGEEMTEDEFYECLKEEDK